MDFAFVLIGIMGGLFCEGKIKYPSNYNKYEIPMKNKNEPMKISIGLIIIKVMNIGYKDSSVDLNVEIFLQWEDQIIDIEGDLNTTVNVYKSDTWSPDLFIYDLESYKENDLGNSFSFITLEKRQYSVFVSYSFEANVVVSCDGQFKNFPFHSHDCFVKIGSWSNDNKHLLFEVMTGYNEYGFANTSSSEYKLKISYLVGEEVWLAGVKNAKEVYSVMGFKLEMKHKGNKFILLYYIPTGLIVMTSWMFFLLPSTSYPARTALLLTVFLLLINIFSGVVRDTPDSNNGGRFFFEYCY